jgi:2,5-diamino-6-(ribosylamino)-4(3H)-pyrimidinone 5'-phosphate reductase
MLSGSETMLAAFAGQEEPPAAGLDEPKQLVPNAVPYLAIVDSRGRINNWRQIQSQPYWGQAVALFSHATPRAALQAARTAGVHYIVDGEKQVDLASALDELNTRFQIQTIRVDSGGTLNGTLLQAGLVDEVSVLMGASLAGSVLPAAFYGAETASIPVSLNLLHCERVAENTVWLRYAVKTGLDEINEQARMSDTSSK